MLKKKQEFLAQKEALKSSNKKLQNAALAKSLIQKDGVQNTSTSKSGDQDKRENKNVEARKKKDLTWIKSSRETDFARQQIMAQKVELYERLQRGDLRHPDDKKRLAAESTLIDFEQKHYSNYLQQKVDEPSLLAVNDELIEITDEFGRLRRVPKSQSRAFVDITVNVEDDYKEYDSLDRMGYHMVPPTLASSSVAEKKKREAEAQQEFIDLVEASKQQEHFDATKDLRTMGAAYYKFSSDEATRAQQAASLQRLHDETLAGKKSMAELKEKRRTDIGDRLDRMKSQKTKNNLNLDKKEMELEARSFLSDLLNP